MAESIFRPAGSGRIIARIKVGDSIILDQGDVRVVGLIQKLGEGGRTRIRLDAKFQNSINFYIRNGEDTPEPEKTDEELEKLVLYKLVTNENYELIAWFLDVNPGSAKAFIGMWASWVDSENPPQWINWIKSVPEKYTTVTDGYLADRIAKKEKN